VDTEYLTNSSYFPQTILKPEVYLEIHKSLFCTLQKTHCSTITKTNMNNAYSNNWWLLQESQKTHKYSRWAKCRDFSLTVGGTVHTIPAQV
jgi:hypothetical protein